MLWNQMVLGTNSQSVTDSDITLGKLLNSFEVVSLSVNKESPHLPHKFI